uniref:Secreted protein n=1 Tax=Parascaris univalens TaxID=6257 RepID=A0A915B5R8_PARUN
MRKWCYLLTLLHGAKLYEKGIEESKGEARKLSFVNRSFVDRRSVIIMAEII